MENLYFSRFIRYIIIMSEICIGFFLRLNLYVNIDDLIK